MYLVKCKYCEEEIDLWEISMHLETCPKREEWEKDHEEKNKGKQDNMSNY